ncbi:hypothetical protein TSUD_59550 [Trifolium subterraneum]|uniref:F-box associated beta-propeller type 3 domain-containing protein n=1 Tax=Trifolium subterraneum TaxID=3900 RepID=A0A2Z6MVL1_TRISU|nr:hypothetical protein TSUD_59550 [Trifolium subterraneum]
MNEDLETEILLRLPLKSLMRFKCVQTSWNNLIKTPYFVNRKSNLSISQNRSLLIIEGSKLKLLPCDDTYNQKPILVNSLFPNHLVGIESYGSCNGVFCLKGHDQLIMWNPTTNEVHHIPRAPSRKNHFSYGFGAVGGDFKVIRLTSYIKGMSTLLCPFAEVYSLNTKSWTIIGCPRVDVTQHRPTRYIFALRHPSARYNALVNGVYYWITGSDLDIFPCANILCFDFSNDEFRQFKSPTSCVPHTTYCHDFIEVKGSLGYVLQSNSSYNVWFEIWVMDQNEWSKKYEIQTSMCNLRRFGVDAAEIFGGKAGELLKSYDHHGKKLRQFQIEIPETDYFKIYEYVPSITLLSK